jgi:hypothetical protein
MRLTVIRCETLRALDQTLYAGRSAIVGTQYGDVTVRKSLTPGYCAHRGDGSYFSNDYAYGFTPTTAFLGLAEKLKAKEADVDMTDAKGEKVGAVPSKYLVLSPMAIANGCDPALSITVNIAATDVGRRDLGRFFPTKWPR